MLSPTLFALAAFLVVLGLGGIVAVGRFTRRLIRDAELVGGLNPRRGLRNRLSARLDKTAAGRSMRAALAELQFNHILPIDLVLAVVAGSLLVWLLTANFISSLLAPIFALSVIPSAWLLVRRQQGKRREKFISQMPQLARVLSNATSANLQLPAAIAIAAQELPDPVRAEMRQVSNALQVGESLDRALSDLQERLPSREIAVLVSTLVVSSRAGGSMISSLRRIADTLDERKQTRREVLTSLAEARSTAVLIPVIGLGSLLMVRTIDSSAIDRMLADSIGQIIFIAAGVLYVVGGFLFNRVTKVDI